VEPYVKGANILRDPGFELHVANTGGGPQGDEIPGEYTGLRQRDRQNLRWSDRTIMDPSLTGWRAQVNVPVGVGYSKRRGWLVSDANPRTGTYHLRSAQLDDTGTYEVAGLYPHSIVACHGGNDPFYACRINPGDYMRFSLWAMVDIVPGNAYIKWMFASYYKADGTLSASGSSPSLPTQGSENLTTTYTQYQFDGFAPFDAYFLSIWFEPDHDYTTSTALRVDVDDCVLEVT
jgi:hypothetical protein